MVHIWGHRFGGAVTGTDPASLDPGRVLTFRAAPGSESERAVVIPDHQVPRPLPQPASTPMWLPGILAAGFLVYAYILLRLAEETFRRLLP